MTASRREEITKALVKHLKDLAAQLNTPGRHPSEHFRFHEYVSSMSHSHGFTDAVASGCDFYLCLPRVSDCSLFEQVAERTFTVVLNG